MDLAPFGIKLFICWSSIHFDIGIVNNTYILIAQTKFYLTGWHFKENKMPKMSPILYFMRSLYPFPNHHDNITIAFVCFVSSRCATLSKMFMRGYVVVHEVCNLAITS